MDDLCYLCEPTEYHIKRGTVKFILDQGVMREFTRHRVFSFACESTRYCNYSKGKFNEEITFIEPCWEMSILERDIFISNLSDAESHYMALLNAGWKPQQARNVLPLATKCDLVMTGFVDDWGHFLDLRARGTTGAPHPQAKELAEPLLTEFIKRNYLIL
jgi:thymidylate synthase (FAD)